jgi:2-oxoglutarate/2-oxoacid ferredoxin oxidoreductase subunit beta
MFGLKDDWRLDPPPRYFSMEDYSSGVARWCPGCGDHGVLTAVQRICRDEQLKPENTVVVSGIGCSSRFPHYMNTYGFHGLHGRAFPVACGVKSRRPELTVFVATGDGDCCSIGAAHWIHAIRYNMDMTVMLYDNAVYGLTKNQTSPTSPEGFRSNTHPRGAWLPPLNPLSTTLGVANVSFVAQTVDWNPIHLHATLVAAYKHKGFSFVRILQRCPQFSSKVFEELQNDPSKLLMLNHEDGLQKDDTLDRLFKTQMEHDPSRLDVAKELAMRTDVFPIGILYQNAENPRYEEFTALGRGMTNEEKIAAFEEQLDRFAINAR